MCVQNINLFAAQSVPQMTKVVHRQPPPLQMKCADRVMELDVDRF
jgi:hypothetical protein